MASLKQIGIALSKRLNALLGGDASMTFSARCYMRGTSGAWYWVAMRNLVDLIFFLDPEHCRDAFFNGDDFPVRERS